MPLPLADKYRTLVILAADGSLGQMMEPAEMPPMRPLPDEDERPDWAVRGAAGRPKRIITSLFLNEDELEALNNQLQVKLRAICSTANNAGKRSKPTMPSGCWSPSARWGEPANRRCAKRVSKASASGCSGPSRSGRSPKQRLHALLTRMRGTLVVEMNAGQMLNDVRLAAAGSCPIAFYGRTGGAIPLPDEVMDALNALTGADQPATAGKGVRHG